jgi:23S rRNA (cytosine1962-C5)-methyltransferase
MNASPSPEPAGTSRGRQRPLDPPVALPAVWLRGAARHPWVYRKQIARLDPQARPGDLVEIRDAEGQVAGYGLVNPKSTLTLRILSRGSSPPDRQWWQAQLASAVQLRRELWRLDAVTDAYRLVHAEGDGLSGLVVDKLADVLSIECFSLGMYQRAVALAEHLAPLAGTRHYVIRGSPAMLSQEGREGEEIRSGALATQTTIQEFGTRFKVDLAAGHKTGFFCDQRENRRLLASLCQGRSVLDVCCYTGGFAIQAKKLGKAAEVVGVDLDASPLALARANADLNQVRVRFVQADAFHYLRDLLATGRTFDVVVLDPPKFIRTRAEREEGTRRHFDLNRLAMRVVAPGGLLVSCTCAGLLGGETFLQLLAAAARQAGREIAPATESRGPWYAPRTAQMLARTGAGPDHPVALDCPQSEYLQVYWLRLL